MDKPVSDNRRMDIPRKAKEECPKSGSVTRWRGRRIHFSGWVRTTICTIAEGMAPEGAGNTSDYPQIRWMFHFHR
jgi:hypothetical protein